jgi:hypothetical protein
MAAVDRKLSMVNQIYYSNKGERKMKIWRDNRTEGRNCVAHHL